MAIELRYNVPGDPDVEGSSAHRLKQAVIATTGKQFDTALDLKEALDEVITLYLLTYMKRAGFNQ
jgi:hypothetical protein